MTAANVKFETIAMWIQIWDAPFDMIFPIVATEIGKRLEEVVEVEKKRSQDTEYIHEGEGSTPNVQAVKAGGIPWLLRGPTNVGLVQV